MTIAFTAPKNSDPEPLVMSTAQYHDLTKPRGIFIQFSIHTFNKTSKHLNSLYVTKFSEKLDDTFFMPSGIGASCVLKSNSSGALCDGNNLTNGCYDDGCDDIFTSNSVQKYGWTSLSGKYCKYEKTIFLIPYFMYKNFCYSCNSIKLQSYWNYFYM
jgi:hypothetical protein